ncbi:MAG TPA: OprD family outer membrane porin [Burkholderiales bacterium]|nr:OprD family outer membrane porin [Burkholderiales bacterium]
MAHRTLKFTNLRTLAGAGLALALSSTSVPALAITGDEVSRGLGKESEVTVHLRSYYLERDRPAPSSDLGAWALGGWLGYQSGWIADFLRVGAVAYTSQPLWAPDDKDGTLLLKPGQEGYTVLGQAYVALRMQQHVFTGFRQLVDQPEVNARDIRMTPNTFNGYTLGGKVGEVVYYGGYLDKLKTINSDEFRDMAAVAGVSTVGSQAMWLGGLAYKPAESLALRFSIYDVSDVLGSTFLDAVWTTPLSQDMRLKLSGQYMFQSSNGTALTGTSWDTYAAGLKADLTRGPLTLTTFYNQTGRGQNYQTPYGGWAGYAYMIVTDFNRAGETALAIGGSYDFKASVPGLSLTAYAVYGSDAVVAATGAPSTDKTEYDLTVDYRFGAERWPDWLRPLWLRFRYANVDESTVGTTHDFRVIANWEWVFK